MMNLNALSEQELFDNLKRLTRAERDATAKVVEYLHEVDKRKLYREWGYSSLFFFCTKGLRYSEGAAMRRIQAARLLETNPEVLEKLEVGLLTLSAISELSRVPTTERSELITASEGKSKFEVQKLVATKIPVKAPSFETVKVSAIEAPFSKAPPERRYSVTLELSEEEYQLLQEVQTITSERIRSRAILRALKLYRRLKSPKERQRRREERMGNKTVEKTSAAPKATAAAMVTVTRHVPAKVRDEVIIEGNDRCCFVAKNGIRCEENLGLQVEHVKPYSIGGSNDPKNLRLICGAHNRYLYEQLQTS